MASPAAASSVEINIPARMDRLPWSRFHVLVVFALGVTWVLDGLEVTIVGALGPRLQDPRALALTEADIGGLASAYLVGAVMGALIFGWLTDRYGRKIIFFVTLGLYVAGVLFSAFAWDFWSLAAFRLLTGVGIGGEYAAVNSAIDELIPARLRGRVALIVNGSFWAGAALGSLATVALLDPTLFAVDLGWRLGFGIGAALGLLILLTRRFVPESPRWLACHDRVEEGEAVVAEIERTIEARAGGALPRAEGRIRIHPQKTFGFGLIFSTMFGRYRGRSALVLLLMVAQAFLYNAIFFTYGLVLTKFYAVAPDHVGLYLVPFAIGNVVGPIVLGPFFDTVGRRRMIFMSYGVAGLLLFVTGWLFAIGALTALTKTTAWCVIFFFASAAASAAYLTASEVFPLEMRALAIAAFYALGTAIGGVVAPYLFGLLIGSGEPWPIFWGYAGAAALMIVAGVAALLFGIDAEGKSLEDVAPPLSLAA
ncbi:MFS transporter [Hansschlegelia plantiphila]|uniref:MFS transporter n=1 Tax=Hansschlegelia plantiphila TaxID=374655 RepID=A0A9W6J2V5_9HYPH|nr:MFS transporter [Hansschlegelia plantiphila]GLK69322.1 MFS transporter [Hansschlegelia plantiphila]